MKRRACPDCENESLPVDRRQFLTTVGVAAAAGALPLWATPKVIAAPPTPKSAAETAVKGLFDSLTPEQKQKDVLRLGSSRREARPAAHARLEQLADHRAAHPQRLLHASSSKTSFTMCSRG